MIRVVKKDDLSRAKANLLRISAIILGFLSAGLVILIIGNNPIEVYREMLKGAFGTGYGIRNSITLAIPYLIVGLGVSIAFNMKFWNIGAEGQLVMGAVFATLAIRLLPDNMNGILLSIIMFLSAVLGGAIWALIPGLFKAFSNTNETLFTLMMNYVAIKFTFYLRNVPWKDPGAKGYPQIARIPDNTKLPKLWGVHIGWTIALVLVVFVYVFLKHTKKGYEIRVVGASFNTAKYAGMNVKKVMLLGIMLSGAISGIAGYVKLTGISYSVSEAIGGGDGFTAIIIAWLSQLSAPVMVLVSYLFASLRQGSQTIEVLLGIPSSVTDIIQGMILFFALGSEFFIRYKFVFEGRQAALESAEDIDLKQNHPINNLDGETNTDE